VDARRLKPVGSLPFQFDIKETPAVKRELTLLMLRHAFITLISRMKENKMVSNKAILIADIDKLAHRYKESISGANQPNHKIKS
jgi:hypothetical protein